MRREAGRAMCPVGSCVRSVRHACASAPARVRAGRRSRICAFARRLPTMVRVRARACVRASAPARGRLLLRAWRASACFETSRYLCCATAGRAPAAVALSRAVSDIGSGEHVRARACEGASVRGARATAHARLPAPRARCGRPCGARQAAAPCHRCARALRLQTLARACTRAAARSGDSHLARGARAWFA